MVGYVVFLPITEHSHANPKLQRSRCEFNVRFMWLIQTKMLKQQVITYSTKKVLCTDTCAGRVHAEFA